MSERMPGELLPEEASLCIALKCQLCQPVKETFQCEAGTMAETAGLTKVSKIGRMNTYKDQFPDIGQPPIKFCSRNFHLAYKEWRISGKYPKFKDPQP